MQYGEPIAGATPQRVAKVLLNANIGHKDLVAVDVDVASTAARSVGHGAGVATEDAGDGAGVRGLFFVKSGELRQLEAEGGRGARGRISKRPVKRTQRGVPTTRAERRARGGGMQAERRARGGGTACIRGSAARNIRRRKFQGTMFTILRCDAWGRDTRFVCQNMNKSQ
jgi:hypothetical protein